MSSFRHAGGTSRDGWPAIDLAGNNHKLAIGGILPDNAKAGNDNIF